MLQNIYYIIDMIDTLRKNVNEDQCVVKFPIGASTPGLLSTSGYASYNHSEILTELADTNWTADIIYIK